MWLTESDKKQLIEQIKRELRLPTRIESKGYENINMSNPESRALNSILFMAREDVLVRPGETKSVPTGVSLKLPEGKLIVFGRSKTFGGTPLQIDQSPYVGNNMMTDIDISVFNKNFFLADDVCPDASALQWTVEDFKRNGHSAQQVPLLLRKGDAFAIGYLVDSSSCVLVPEKEQPKNYFLRIFK